MGHGNISLAFGAKNTAKAGEYYNPEGKQGL
jgi:hypothetical protein